MDIKINATSLLWVLAQKIELRGYNKEAKFLILDLNSISEVAIKFI
jgi:hypothetical protein